MQFANGPTMMPQFDAQLPPTRPSVRSIAAGVPTLHRYHPQPPQPNKAIPRAQKKNMAKRHERRASGGMVGSSCDRRSSLATQCNFCKTEKLFKKYFCIEHSL